MPETDTIYVSPGKAAHRLNKNPRTIVRWLDGLTEPDVITTAGGHRRIAEYVVDRWVSEKAAAS